MIWVHKSSRLRFGILVFAVLNFGQRYKDIQGLCYVIFKHFYWSFFSLKNFRFSNFCCSKLVLHVPQLLQCRTVRAISSDRGKVVSGSDDLSVIVWDKQTTQLLEELKGHDAQVCLFITS